MIVVASVAVGVRKAKGCYGIGTAGTLKLKRIVAITAVQNVISGATRKCVITRFPKKLVIARISSKAVIALFAIERVVVVPPR
ncbi:MAG: hypothetical protein RLZZ437_3057 [Pseudomonadota bacterium]